MQAVGSQGVRERLAGAEVVDDGDAVALLLVWWLMWL